MEGWDKVDIPFHIDMETVAGATIPTLRKCWERNYMSNPLPTDTLLVAWLNDIKQLVTKYKGPAGDINALAESVSEDIMRHINSLYVLTLEHHCRNNVKDTFAVSTILRVPAMYWSELDGALPSPDYTNLREVVDRTNLKIQAFNLKNGRRAAPRLQQGGDKGKPHKRVYIWNSWVGDRKEDMMNLKDPQRCGLAKVIVKYFEKGTPLSGQHLD